MRKLILFLFTSSLTLHAQSPEFKANMERVALLTKLSDSSPCILAFAKAKTRPAQPSSSELYCVMDRRADGRSVCQITGYDWRRDSFLNSLPNGKSPYQVDQSCYDGGLDRLLNENTGRATLRNSLQVDSEFIFSADKEFTAIFNRGLTKPVEPPSLVASSSARSSSVDKNSSRFTPVKVFYATDRSPEAGAKGSMNYTDARNDDGSLRFGVAEVSIPKTHQKGNIEGASIFRLEFSEDPKKHVVVRSVIQEDAKDFMSRLRGKVMTSREGEAFVFVHGYNTTFEDGLKRTAQLTYDLNFDGAPVLYSWPAGDKIWKYSVAEANVEWTFRHLQKFLVDLAQQSGAKRIHLIAHSMGNRALTNALSQIQVTGDTKPFHQIILAAPDIDTQVFDQIAASITKVGDRITIYASEKDEALTASQKFHSYRRLGQGGPGIFTHLLTDTIDASRIGGTLLGHSYFGDSDVLLADLSLLLTKNLEPKMRPSLAPQKAKPNFFWQFLIKEDRK